MDKVLVVSNYNSDFEWLSTTHVYLMWTEDLIEL